jgi:hypothetical protein
MLAARIIAQWYLLRDEGPTQAQMSAVTNPRIDTIVPRGAVERKRSLRRLMSAWEPYTPRKTASPKINNTRKMTTKM